MSYIDTGYYTPLVTSLEFKDFVISDNETEYPESGTGSDGYMYKMIKSLISFTINGTIYQAEEGMTWAEWISSSYNTGGYRVEGGLVFNSQLGRHVLYNDDYISIEAVIIANRAYSLGGHSG